MIKNQTYLLNKGTSLNASILTANINSFWDDVFTNLSNNHLLLIAKIQFINNEWRTLAELRKVNFTDKQLFIEYLTSRLGLFTDSYKDTPILKIQFDYIAKDGLADDKRLILNSEEYQVATYSYNKLNLPLTMDPYKFGEVFAVQESDGITKYAVTSGPKTIHITQSFGDTVKYTLGGSTINYKTKVNTVHYTSPIDLTFVDTEVTPFIFKREINKDVLYIEAEEVIVSEKQLPAKPFSAGIVEKDLAGLDVFSTIDIETVLINGLQTPYLICGYDSGQKLSCYATDLSESSISKMFHEFIRQLLDRCSTTKFVYAHNFSGFDGILLLKHLISYDNGTVKPILFHGKLIGVRFIYKDPTTKKSKTLVFKDSLLMLPMPLRKLCKAFSVSTIKTNFPFLLSDINYVGEFPKFDLWSDLTQVEYDTIKANHGNQPWSFKDQAIKYCQIDCIALYEVLVKFNSLVFEHFKVNIHNSYTLPSLAMRIFKSQFMPKNTLFQMLGKVEWDIREAYTGGAVDVYINHNCKNGEFGEEREKLYYYDVNSLYPYVMANIEVPIGKPIAFQGDIRKVDPKAFGFFFCKINTPEYLEHPILQRRIKTVDGIRTIAGLGSWEGWVSSIEMDLCVKLGYKFEILKGYKFND